MNYFIHVCLTIHLDEFKLGNDQIHAFYIRYRILNLIFYLKDQIFF